MKLLKSIILRIEELLDNRQHNSDGVTSQQIVDKLQAHFKEVIEEMSTKETLVFPMTFTIYLHQKDYEKINPYFQAFGKEIVNKFYKIIREKHQRGRKLTDIHANSWNIYITPAESVELGDNRSNIQKGNIKIWSSAFDIIDNKEANRNISFRTDDNRLINVNIDEAILNKISLDGHIQVKWENPLEESQQAASVTTSLSRAHSNIRMTRGELSYTIPGGATKVFSILTDSCQISGEKDTREDSSIFKIKSPKVETRHAEIRYDAQFNEFELAAYQQTSINYKEVPLSVGGDIKWMKLPNNAKIILANSIIVNFKRLI